MCKGSQATTKNEYQKNSTIKIKNFEQKEKTNALLATALPPTELGAGAPPVDLLIVIEIVSSRPAFMYLEGRKRLTKHGTKAHTGNVSGLNLTCHPLAGLRTAGWEELCCFWSSTWLRSSDRIVALAGELNVRTQLYLQGAEEELPLRTSP